MKNKNFKIGAKTGQGFVLLYAVLVASVVLAIGMSLINIITRQIVLSSIGKSAQAAYYAADGARDCAYYWYTNGAFGLYDAVNNSYLRAEDLGTDGMTVSCSNQTEGSIENDSGEEPGAILQLLGVTLGQNPTVKKFTFKDRLNNTQAKVSVVIDPDVSVQSESSLAGRHVFIVSHGFSSQTLGARTAEQILIYAE